MNVQLIETAKETVINQSPKPFGKTHEILIKNLFDFSDADDQSYDLKNGKYKIEAKGSRVFFKAENKILTEENCFDILTNYTPKTLLSANDMNTIQWDSNMQQIKPKCFDYLYYSVFFNERIYIFKISSEQIISDAKKVGHIDKQHRGNTGEGQMHLKPTNIKYHLDTYLCKILTWTEFLELIKIKP